MISAALRTDIEIWMSRRDENPVYRLAREGRLSHSVVARYIANVTFMVGHTPGHLARARSRSEELGDSRLEAWCDHKYREELGHVTWGEEDIVSLTRLTAAPVTTTPTPSIARLALYLTGLTEEDPALYLPYVAFTEYITAVVGPELLAMIEEGCGVPRGAMTILDKHVELDRHHAEEGFGVIDDVVVDPRKLAPMRRSLAEMLRLFDAFCEEVCEEVPATRVDDESERRVSAA